MRKAVLAAEGPQAHRQLRKLTLPFGARSLCPGLSYTHAGCLPSEARFPQSKALPVHTQLSGRSGPGGGASPALAPGTSFPGPPQTGVYRLLSTSFRALGLQGHGRGTLS